ncbi:SPT2 chromatin protein domain containing 1, partial [Chelydra serpentina]
ERKKGGVQIAKKKNLVFSGLPRPSLPPISYKRQIEDDEEYDSEM